MFTLLNAKIIPIYKSFANKGFEDKSIEKESNKIRAVKICTKRREIKFFSHTRKNHSDEFVIKLKNAKGEMSTKTWIIIYLKELLNTKFIKPKDVNDFTIPSKENRLNSPDIDNVLFMSSIKSEKLKLDLNSESQRNDKPSVIIETIFIICSQIQREEFIMAIKIIVLNINCLGESTLE